MPIRVLIADDHRLVREGFRALIERDGLEVVAEAENGREAVRLAAAHRPDVAVLDLSMPLLNGLDAARDILRDATGVKVVLLTMHKEDHQVIAALRAGVRGYVVKTQAAPDVTQAIREVAAGGVYISPAVSPVADAHLSGAPASVDPLTRREREVLQLVAEGSTTKEIAIQLHISVKTAESYRSRLMAKLDIHDTAGLVRHALRLGMIQIAAIWCVAPALALVV